MDEVEYVTAFDGSEGFVHGMGVGVVKQCFGNS